ncbi:MAG TPA: SusC/RagA family TonB-linked outer membrane protein [Gemmatimonadales bacterium]|nr:SusC/RagA family TonB-linked outer membrane protein [Gemmatimonadales bacterium]
MRRSVCLCLGLLGSAVGARLAAAQAGGIAGVVVEEIAGRPLAGVEVSAGGVAVTTDAEGRFRLEGLSGAEVVLSVRGVGYRPVQRTVSVGAVDLRIVLTRAPIELEAVVVTGTPGEVQQRQVANAVSRISGDALIEAPVTSVQDVLNGRAPSVVVLPASGNVGSGSRLRIRGASSPSLGNQPLVYVDGVRVNAASATGPVNQAFGSSSISRINDLNPDDIESIEIIKGPAAATLYGTEASNGVIQIITKRGTRGATRWNFTARQGTNFFSNPEERLWVNYARDPGTGQILSIDLVEREDSLGHPIWRNGHLQEYDLNVSGGSDVVQYFLGGGLEDNEGVDQSNDLRRYSVRGNFTVRPSGKLTTALNLGYVTGRTNLACEAGCGGRVWGTVLANPLNLTGPNASRRGFHSGTPEQYDLLENYWQDLDRFTASLQVTHQPTSWFSHRLNFGTDRTREEDVTFTPRVDSLINHPVWGSQPLGFKAVNDRTLNVTTVDYAATATFAVTPQVRSATSFGGQHYWTRDGFVYAQGREFPAPGLTAISATVRDRFNAQDFVEEKSLGFFVQEQIAWRDRVFVTLGLRSDDHSAFGPNFDRAYYPKAGVSWVVSGEPFWRFSWLNALRVRAAYGESGLQPQTFAAIRTYQPVTGPSDSAAVTPQFIGNPDLGPERGREWELGFEASAFGDRVGVELTYYNKRVTDAILERQIAPSVGIPGTQFFNAGKVANRGLELQVRGRPYEGQRVNVDLTFNLSTNSNEILELDPRDPSQFFTPSAFIRHQVGYPVGSWFEQRVLSAQFDTLGNAVNVMCDDGQGGAMPCMGANGVWGGGDDAPDVYLGRTTPKVEGSFASTITLWDRVRISGLLDFKTGFRKLDGNTRVRCPIFNRCRENFFPTEFDPKRIAGIQSSNNLVDYLIDDASFAKLREVSIAYTLPDRYARRLSASRATVSVAGRNLYTWTGYGGLEPEAYFLGGSRSAGFSLWEQTTIPQLTTWVVTVNLAF